MLREKGTRVAFNIKGREHDKRRPDIVVRPTYVLMRDPEGRFWPKCSALVGPFPGRGRGPVVEDPYARRWVGRGVELRQGTVMLPPREQSAWKTIGEVEALYYLRPGRRAPGMYRHEFNGAMLDRLLFGRRKVTLRSRGRFYRIDMGSSCTIDDRGFVSP